MENSIILTPLLVFFFVILLISIYLLVMHYKKTNNEAALKQISDKMAGFDRKDLDLKMKKIEKVLAFGVDKELYDQLKGELTRLASGKMVQVLNIQEQIKGWLSKPYVPVFHDIQRKLQDLDEAQFEYIAMFLDLRFKMNELLVNQELQETIIYKVRDLFSDVSQLKRSKVHEEINDSKPFKKQIVSIEDKLKKLEENAYRNKNPEDIITDVKNIVRDIQSAHIDAHFLLDTLNFLKIELPALYSEFKAIYEKDPSIFFSLNSEFKKTLLKVKSLERESFVNALQLKRELVKKQITEISKELKNAIKIASLNYESYNFITNYENKIIKIVNEFEIKKEYLIEEISRYEIENKQEYIKTIDTKSKIINNQVHAYKRAKSETFRKNNPYALANELSKIVEEFEEYIQYIRENLKDINKIIQQTDEINQEIAKMNVLLLDVETKMSHLPRNIQFKQKEQFGKLQKATSRIIEIFKDNTESIPSDVKKTVDKLYEKIIEFNNSIATEAFIFHYIKWVIMELNKYIHTDENFIHLLNKVEEAYNSADAPEALRIAKNITDVYKIYE